MSWLRRHMAWAWPAVLLAGLLATAAIRLWSDWASGPVPSLAAQTDGVVAGESDDLATAARRFRLLQDQSGETRGRLAALQSDVSAKRQQVRTLDAMLASNRLTDCPAFLQQQTTVRALQKIICEAADTGVTEAADQSRLNTAAAVARERLRRKLEAIRSQLAEDIDHLEAQATATRHQLHFQTAESQRLRRRLQRQLESRAPGRQSYPAT